MSLDVYLKLTSTETPDRQSIYIRKKGRIIRMTTDEWNDYLHGCEWNEHLHGQCLGVAPITINETGGCEVYWGNITHNLGRMAEQAGLYACLWRPDEHGITTARQLIEPLQTGLKRLTDNPEYYQQFNPPNGWGSYDTLVSFVTEYLGACQKWQDAEVSVQR